MHNLAAPGGQCMFAISQDQNGNGGNFSGTFKGFPITVEGLAACVREARALGQVRHRLGKNNCILDDMSVYWYS